MINQNQCIHENYQDNIQDNIHENKDNKKNIYYVLNHLSIHKDNYHIIEDYIKYYLFQSNEIIPYSYIFLFTGVMKKRIINAKNSEIKSFDSRHAKATVFSLMAIIVYIHRLKNNNHTYDFTKSNEYYYLIQIFEYYSKYIIEYIDLNKHKYENNVKKSLSIFAKMNNTCTTTTTLQKDSTQYKYCYDWMNKLTNYFFIQFTGEVVTNDIFKDSCVIFFMKKYDELHFTHSALFKLNINELDQIYSNYPIQLFFE